MQNMIRARARNQKGSFIVSTMVSALLIVLPLGLYAFEVARTNLAAFQLHVATDAAALAAASFLQYADFHNQNDRKKAKDVALKFLQQNLVTGVSLQNAAFSSTVQQDNPAGGASTFDLSFNDEDKTVTAVAAFGLQPAFATFLGISSLPIRVNSSAGSGGMVGDICVVVDLSGSMGHSSRSVAFTRQDNGNKVTHSIVATSTLPPAFQSNYPVNNIVPDPSAVDFTKSKLMQSLQNAPAEVKLAALVEARLGHLENSAVYESSHANLSALSKTNLVPGPGYQDDYQRLALSQTLPLADAKDALATFVQMTESSPGAHFSLVTYSTNVSGSEGHDSFSTRNSFKHPQVDLNKENARGQDITEALAPAPTFGSTNTGDAVMKAVSMLEGGQHRNGAPKTIILLTDGVANAGMDPVEASKEAGKKGVKLMSIGFFHNEVAMRVGRPLLNSMVASAGNGSKAFFAPDVPTLHQVLEGIANGDPSLINR